jgi:hypothetical protein
MKLEAGMYAKIYNRTAAGNKVVMEGIAKLIRPCKQENTWEVKFVSTRPDEEQEVQRYIHVPEVTVITTKFWIDLLKNVGRTVRLTNKAMADSEDVSETLRTTIAVHGTLECDPAEYPDEFFVRIKDDGFGTSGITFHRCKVCNICKGAYETEITIE